jgi:hypothetical protein
VPDEKILKLGAPMRAVFKICISKLEVPQDQCKISSFKNPENWRSSVENWRMATLFPSLVTTISTMD